MAARPGPGTGAGARDRRASGLLVLLLAVILVLGAAALLDRGVRGTATAVPLPEPPPVGSCLTLTADTAEVVPCEGAHHAEVVQTWPAGTLPAGVRDVGSVAAYPFAAGGQVSTPECTAAHHAWVRDPRLPGSDLWNPTSPVLDSQLLAAPPGQRTPERGWIACILVAPDREPLAGALRAGTGAAAPPSRLGSCLRAATGTWGPVPLTCDQPHRIEILASFRIRSAFDADGRFLGMPTGPALTAGCGALVAAVTGNADPSFGGRLRVRAVSLFPAAIHEVNATDLAGNPVHTFIPLPQCAVELVGDGSLTGTVVGLGERLLPLG